MTFIPEKDARDLKAQLAVEMEGPVTMDFFTRPAASVRTPDWRDCETCAETQQLLEEAAALSDKIALRVHDVTADPQAAAEAGVTETEVPAVVLTGAAKDRVRLLGIPAGLEFWTLLRSIIDVARGPEWLIPTEETIRVALRRRGWDWRCGSSAIPRARGSRASPWRSAPRTSARSRSTS